MSSVATGGSAFWDRRCGVRSFSPSLRSCSSGTRAGRRGLTAIETWRANPTSFESRASLRDGRNERLNDFLSAFNLPGFRNLSKRLGLRDGDFSSYLTKERVFRFVSLARNPPVAVLWHALGYDRARTLPGTMGNLLVAPHDVSDASSEVSRAYDGISAERSCSPRPSFLRSGHLLPRPGQGHDHALAGSPRSRRRRAEGHSCIRVPRTLMGR